MKNSTADIIVVGASAGGVQALEDMVAGFPANLPAAVFVVLHLPPWSVSQLPEILARSGPLPATQATDGGAIRYGHIYVAPPNHHLLVSEGRIQLGMGPKENRQRPAVNVLFRSAALAYGPRVIGLVLTGALDDGAAGLWDIKQHGGTTIVQAPSSALFPDMPRNALENVPVDYVAPLEELATLLTDLAGKPVTVPESQMEYAIDAISTDLTCPECRGPITEFRRGPLSEYRCRVGHSYSPETFLAAHSETRERTLWATVVALEEGADIARDLARRHPSPLRQQLEQEAGHNTRAAMKVRAVLASLSLAHTSISGQSDIEQMDEGGNTQTNLISEITGRQSRHTLMKEGPKHNMTVKESDNMAKAKRGGKTKTER
jgi:two-component system, chemotaxis family, protein-glutamate methylesterase/glutaminase